MLVASSWDTEHLGSVQTMPGTCSDVGTAVPCPCWLEAALARIPCHPRSSKACHQRLLGIAVDTWAPPLVLLAACKKEYIRHCYKQLVLVHSGTDPCQKEMQACCHSAVQQDIRKRRKQLEPVRSENLPYQMEMQVLGHILHRYNQQVSVRSEMPPCQIEMEPYCPSAASEHIHHCSNQVWVRSEMRPCLGHIRHCYHQVPVHSEIRPCRDNLLVLARSEMHPCRIGEWESCCSADQWQLDCHSSRMGQS
mmetsp:Transcript_15751/g.28703  ORF Transcript_15751/g.28703 Transcript_15751/m.28703 type:complete len:250 (-) Transcript_15751:780-1529(-)